MSVAEVRQQVEYVALVTKQASSVSDLRNFAFAAPAVRAPVVYFRAAQPGVCTYMDDSRTAAVPHGACWYDLCPDLEVVDIPGDHFSILRQDLGDMNLIVTALKQKLAPFGWTEAVRREHKAPGYAVSAAEMQDIDSYLQKMGVKDPALRRRLEIALPGADPAAAAGGAELGLHAVSAANAVAAAAASSGDARGAPVLLLCCDAGGSLGGLEPLVAALELPVYAVCMPEGDVAEAPADMAELASLAMKAARGVVPPGSRLLLGGVGYGAVLAHELALQLSDSSTDAPLAVALFEGAHSLRSPARLLSWLPEAWRQEVCQVASALYPAVLAGAGSAAPSLEAFAARLASIPGYDEQLEYVATFRPAQEKPADWERRVDGLLSRLTYWQALAAAYAAGDIFPGATLLFAQHRPAGSAQEAANLLAAGGPGGAWQSIAFLVQPVAVHELAADIPAAAGSSSAPNSPGLTAAARQVEALLLAAAEQGAEAEALSPEAAAARHGSSMLLTPRLPASPGPFSPPLTSDTASVVLPLNRLCPERRYILRRGGAGSGLLPSGASRSGTPRVLLARPLARLPLWLIHGETGGITGALKELAAALQLPCYGLAMGGDAAHCSTLAELAAHYVAAIQAVQPQGPYLLAGCSISGAALAHAAAARLQAAGQHCGLVLLDGCLGQPPGLPLHDTTWYALFYLLREIGSMQGPMGEFIDTVRAAGSPTQQLKLLNSFRPAELALSGASEEQWDAAVYATLDRAALLKRLLRGQGGSSAAPGRAAGFGSADSTPRSSADSGGSPGGTPTFDGPVAALLPGDRLGALMLEATRQQLALPGAAASRVGAQPLHFALGSRHTECLLDERARKATAVLLMDAIRALLSHL